MNNTTTRTQSLVEVAQRVITGGAFLMELADFLDEFRVSPAFERVAEEPPFLDGLIKRGQWMDAYLAAVAEHLTGRHDLPRPEWIYDRLRYLDEPAFAASTREARLFLLKDSPAAFKSRNIFVTGNALDRV
jgi:hypothetical protein